MTNKKPIFRYIDEFIFKQVDLIKESKPYQDTMAQLNSLNDTQIKIFNQFVSSLVIVIPAVILIILFFLNLSSRKELELKRTILKETKTFASAQRQLQSLGQNIISGVALNNRTEFERQVSNSLITSGGKKEGLNTLDFETSPSDGIMKTNAVVKFKGLSTRVLSSFLADLVDRNKFRVSNLQVKKKIKEKVLNGQIELRHYGRIASEGK